MKCTSPCESCSRVIEPRMCEDKTCMRWQRWYLERWEQIHAFYLHHQKGGRR